MAQHIIPSTETDLHTTSQECKCEPEFKMDEESGEMVWLHNIMDWERMLVDFVKL